MADDGVKLSTKEEKTFAELKALGGVKIPVLKKNVNLYQMPIETIEEFATVDSICETQAELLAEITSSTIHTILWKGNTTLIDFVATAGTFKLIYCQHYSLLGKNSTLVAPAGKNITIYGDIDCATPATGGFSWTLNSTATSSIKCKWIRNSGVTGKVGIDAGTVLYERIEAGIFSSVVGGAFLKQEFWDNTNGSTNSSSAEFTDNTDDLAAWDATTATLTPAAGVFYVGTALTAMTLTIPSTATAADEFRVKFTIATGATLTAFDLSSVTSWIGGAPDLAAGNTYEVSVQDGVGVIGLVEAV